MSGVRTEIPTNETMSAGRRKRITSRATCPGVPILAHVGFAGSRHMHPERMPSAKKERTVSLRLFDVEKVTCTPSCIEMDCLFACIGV